MNLSLAAAILDINLKGPTATFDEQGLSVVRGAWEAAKAEHSALIERVKVLEEALRGFVSGGCPECNGDCGAANPPVAMCPMRQALSALSNATGGEGYGLPSQPRSDGTVARLNIDAEPSGAWRTIETAPLGEVALFWHPLWDHPLVGRRDGERSANIGGYGMSGGATHWSPLPPPPRSAS